MNVWEQLLGGNRFSRPATWLFAACLIKSHEHPGNVKKVFTEMINASCDLQGKAVLEKPENVVCFEILWNLLS